MARCDFCGEEVYLPFKCKYCGGLFCSKHHLPEKHNCPVLKAVKTRVKEEGWFYLSPPYPRSVPVVERKPKEKEREEFKPRFTEDYSRDQRYMKAAGILLTWLFFLLLSIILRFLFSK